MVLYNVYFISRNNFENSKFVIVERKRIEYNIMRYNRLF